MDRIILVLGVILVTLAGVVTVFVQEVPVAVPAIAEFPPAMVQVVLTQILPDLARETHRDPTQIPSTLDLPSPEAAQVCGIAEPAFGMGHGMTCLAQTTSALLDRTLTQAENGTSLSPGPPARNPS